MTDQRPLRPATRIAHAGRRPAEQYGAVNPPVVRASTILFDSIAEMERCSRDRMTPRQTSYGRRGTPTTWTLEEAVADLEGGFRTALYPSGAAAVAGALFACVKTGEHALIADSVYGPTRAFADALASDYGVAITYYDPQIGAGIADLMRDETTVVFTESPGSQTFEVQDVPAIAAAAKARGATVLLDNTWASPLYFKPFRHGVDVSIQALTKYVVGHSDAMLGCVTATEELWPAILRGHVLLGQTSGTEEAYLGQRGFRTIGVRLRQHMESGLRVARWLQARPEVARVLHPALESDPGHALWKRDFEGASGLFGIVLKPASEAAVNAMVDGMRLHGRGYSWGGYESLLIPAHPTRTAVPLALEGPLLRIHVGLEDVDDLIADLDEGFDRLRTVMERAA